jgi:hypothetical protein
MKRLQTNKTKTSTNLVVSAKGAKRKQTRNKTSDSNTDNNDGDIDGAELGENNKPSFVPYKKRSNNHDSGEDEQEEGIDE